MAFHGGHVLQDVGGRRDGVRAEIGSQTGQVGAGDQSQGESLVAQNVAIGTWLDVPHGCDRVPSLEELEGVAGVVA